VNDRGASVQDSAIKVTLHAGTTTAVALDMFGPQGQSGMLHDMDLERLRQSREFREFTRPKG
jgi:hypothetical protein